MCSFFLAVNTHVHADHITGSGEIKKHLSQCKSMIAAVSKAKADVHLREGDRIKFGQFELECYSTPGHTDGNDKCQLMAIDFFKLLIIFSAIEFVLLVFLIFVD